MATAVRCMMMLMMMTRRWSEKRLRCSSVLCCIARSQWGERVVKSPNKFLVLGANLHTGAWFTLNMHDKPHDESCVNCDLDGSVSLWTNGRYPREAAHHTKTPSNRAAPKPNQSKPRANQGPNIFKARANDKTAPSCILNPPQHVILVDAVLNKSMVVSTCRCANGPRR